MSGIRFYWFRYDLALVLFDMGGGVAFFDMRNGLGLGIGRGANMPREQGR